MTFTVDPTAAALTRYRTADAEGSRSRSTVVGPIHRFRRRVRSGLRVEPELTDSDDRSSTWCGIVRDADRGGDAGDPGAVVTAGPRLR